HHDVQPSLRIAGDVMDNIFQQDATKPLCAVHPRNLSTLFFRLISDLVTLNLDLIVVRLSGRSRGGEPTEEHGDAARQHFRQPGNDSRVEVAARRRNRENKYQGRDDAVIQSKNDRANQVTRVSVSLFLSYPGGRAHGSTAL